MSACQTARPAIPGPSSGTDLSHPSGIPATIGHCRTSLPSVQDVDWDTQDGSYRVRLQGEWVVVPDAAVVSEPNRFGPAVVWPYLDANGTTQIRCFLPGAGA